MELIMQQATYQEVFGHLLGGNSGPSQLPIIPSSTNIVA